MKVFRKEKLKNGRRHIYFCGMKILSYKKKIKKDLAVQTTKYGKVYFPYYNPIVMPSNKEPEIYNKDGQKMRTFFLRDFHMAADPTHQSKYFMWDKFNIGLDVHFYSHNAMLETMGNPKHKFGFFIETEGIIPKDYLIFDKYPELAQQFELIFTNSKKILDSIPNARFAPMNCSLYGGSFCKPNNYKSKKKFVSILSSNKQMCDLHRFRYNLACLCKQGKLCDTFGTFDGGHLVNIDETLRDYMYSICIENIQTPYLFTERLICALANQCIPIYLGATEIDKFFNPDGIIKLNPNDDITEILKQCTPEEYKRRLPAILDNYERAKKIYKCLGFYL
jgi:hypothetical protein